MVLWHFTGLELHKHLSVCEQNCNSGCMWLSFKNYINVAVILPEYLVHINKHKMLKTVATSPSSCAMSCKTISTQKHSRKWFLTFKWTHLPVKTLIQLLIDRIRSASYPGQRPVGNHIIKLHQNKIKSFFLDNLLFQDAVCGVLMYTVCAVRPDLSLFYIRGGQTKARGPHVDQWTI